MCFFFCFLRLQRYNQSDFFECRVCARVSVKTNRSETSFFFGEEVKVERSETKKKPSRQRRPISIPPFSLLSIASF